jgi:hypothetical protein
MAAIFNLIKCLLIVEKIPVMSIDANRRPYQF